MFPWRNFLTLAIRLSTETEEACLRTAISRAYYAAFCTCSEWYKDKYQSMPPDVGLGSHENLWKAFRNIASEPLCVRIGTFGSILHVRRLEADYDSYPADFSKSVQPALKLADRIITTVGTIK